IAIHDDRHVTGNTPSSDLPDLFHQTTLLALKHASNDERRSKSRPNASIGLPRPAAVSSIVPARYQGWRLDRHQIGFLAFQRLVDFRNELVGQLLDIVLPATLVV